MPHTNRRVVITGIGLVTPLGNDLKSNWEALRSGRGGIATISRFDASQLPSRMAGEVRNFDPATYIDKKEIKKMDPFTHFALAAAQMAVDDSGLRLASVGAERIGVLLGVGIGGIETVEDGVAV